MTIKERAAELKSKYQSKSEYFKSIAFDTLASDFEEFVNFLVEIENMEDAAVSVKAPEPGPAQEEVNETLG